MLNCSDEMESMLAAIGHQVKLSLENIKVSLKRCGTSFNDDFKQSFLRAVNDK